MMVIYGIYEQHSKEVKMLKYRCTVCGYIYDPEIGDVPRIDPGTAFEILPDYWVCPQCGAGKDMFSEEK